MNSQNLVRLIVLGGVCLVATAVTRTQTTPTASATVGKIAVINVRQAIVSTAEGRQASVDLQTEFVPRQNELESLKKQINDLQNRLSAGSTTLSDEEKGRLQMQGQRLVQQLDRKQNYLQEDLNSAQSEAFDRMGKKMLDVIDRYAKQNGIVAVLDSSSQNSPVLFAASSIDLTGEITKLYDTAYPVKTSSAPAKPAVSVPRKP